MLRKLSLLVLATVVGASAFYQPASASSPLLNGQHQYYTVQMRSDNQAITYAKIVFQNGDSTENRKTVTFKLPDGVTASNLSIQQILSKNTTTLPCSQYETIQEWSKRTGEAITPSASQQTKYNVDKQCATEANSSAYNEDYDFVTNSSSDIYNTYYYNRDWNTDTFEYSDLKSDTKDGTYTVTLAHEIQPQKQGAILVSYTSKDFVGGVMGRFAYDYRTLIVNEMIDQTTVSINFDEGLYSRTAKQGRTSSESTAVQDGVAASSDYSSKSLDRLQLSVGSGGTVTKTQSKMLPNDVMSVTGVYATNPVMLFGKELLILLVLVVIAGFGIWRLVVYRKKHRKISPVTYEPLAAGTPVDEQNIQKITQNIPTIHIGRMVAVSAISIGGTLAVLLLIVAVGSVINSNNSYYAYSSIYTTFVPIFAGVVIIYGIFISPVAYMLRFGVKQAFIWTLMQACFGVVALVVALVLAVSLSGGNPYVI